MPANTVRIMVALIALLFTAVFAEANSDFQYYNNGGKITITGYSGTPAGMLVIPNTINGLSVTEIADGAFLNQSGYNDLLTGVSIPSTVTKIGDAAFFSCHGITQITLPTSLTQIGSGAFSFTGLSTISIPQSVTLIGSGAFSDLRNLTAINVHSSNASYSSLSGVLYNKTRTTLILHPPAKAGAFSIPSTVTSITFGAFASSTTLTAVTIPTSVTSIGSTAFASCSRLTSVAIPAGVTSIGSGAFRDCIGMASINVDPANPSYSSVDGVLFNQNQTTLIQCPAGRTGGFTIPPSCTAIGDSAFAGCAGLGSVTIPASVVTIGNSAFENCTSLGSADLPASVTLIGQRAFSRCLSLVEMEIPPGIITIMPYTFSQCAGLTSIVIPDSVTSIQNDAFYKCVSLQEVLIPSGVTSIGNETFSGCISLADAALPDGLTTIGYGAFSRCLSFQLISIPESVTTIGSGAFGYCAGLTQIHVASGNPFFHGLEGALFNKTQTTLIQVPSGKAGFYAIPNSVTSIGSSAFAGCRLLTQVTMGGNVASIGSSAFSYCTGLSDITLGTGVTSIGSAAFTGCTGIEQVTIGPNVATIESFAFSDCDNLDAFNVSAANPSFSSLDGVLYNKTQTTLIQCPGGLAGPVTVPSGVTTIQTNAFSDSRSLAAIHVAPANSAFSSIDGILFNITQTTLIRCPMGKSGTIQISAAVTSISNSAFAGCQQVSAFAVDINNPTYRSIDGVLYNKAGTTLLNCPPARSGAVTLSAIVTSVADGALGGCSFLTAIHVDPANPAYASVDGVLFNKSLSLLVQYPGGKTGYAIIPASVGILGWYAFDERDDLAGLVFLGNAPFSIWFSFDRSVPVQHFEGATGFSPSTWSSWSVINMGVQSPIKLWLLANAFPYDANMTSDMNGDGVSLLIAYALNLNPRDNLASSMPQSGLGGGFLSITYYAAKAGIIYRVETSGDLKTWTTQGVSISPQDANGFRTASVPATDAGRYVRLAVSE